MEVLLKAAQVSEQYKAEARSKLTCIEARSNTALHEGWLTGCRSIASNEAGSQGGFLSRCFLLTDGQANAGLTDPEQIASQAADIHRNAGICTSTFGIGTHYNEGLLGPLAVAGSGQFHHLRNPREIETSFGGELSELFNVVSRNIRIELEIGSIKAARIISQYWVHPAEEKQRLVVDVGDLIGDEERNLVVDLHFPKVAEGEKITVRARLLRQGNGSDYASTWEGLGFEGASSTACDEEIRDMHVMHWVGLHHSERAKKEALDLMREGDLAGSIRRLEGVIRRLSEYAAGDRDLLQSIADLKALRKDLKHNAVDAECVRELSSTSIRMSRGQRDYRASK